MKEVSKEEFYQAIGPKDVHPSPNTITHESVFKTPMGYVKGMVKNHPQTGKPTNYYLS